MAKFLYGGAMSAATLVIDGKEREVVFHPGKTVDLPHDHEYTKTLIARGLLVSVKETAPAAPEATSGNTGGKSDKGGK